MGNPLASFSHEPPRMNDSAQKRLECYRSIAQISEQLLASSREGDWDAAIALGQTYFQEVEALQTLDRQAPLQESERQQLHGLLVNILENDAITRELAIPRLAVLQDLLGRVKRQRAVEQAYGPQQLLQAGVGSL